MIEQLKMLAERIDSLPLRQRAVLFGGVAIVLVVIVHAALIQPLRVRERHFASEVAQQQGEMAAVQAQLQRLAEAGRSDPDAANRARRDALVEDMRRLNARIVEEQRRFTPPERMRGVLEELLERNRRLTLIDLKTLPVLSVAGHRAGQPGGMYRHGIELTVKGTYGELHDYLSGLEKLPNQLYWARAELSVDAHPALILKLTVHTLSFDRAWLVV